MQFVSPFLSLLNEMSPYLLLGFLIAGILKVFVPKEMYIGQISKPTFRSALWAALAGVPLPLCSCGVIPTAMSLRQEGASKGATVAFLISTPQTGVDSIAATYALLGLPFALLRPITAFITGLFGGAAINQFDKNISDNTAVTKEEKTDDNSTSKIVQVLHYAFVEMIGNIGKWLVFGIVIAGLIAILIPDSIFTAYLNNPLLNMLIVLAIAIPTYTCATGSIPLAAVLMMKGLTPGAAFVFLMAGPATSIASITVIGKMLGRKTLMIYLASIIIGSVACGLLIDYVLPASWFSMSMMNHDLIHQHHHEGFSWFKSLCSAVLVLLLVNAFVQNYLYSAKLKKQSMTAKTYMIGGMTCNHCRMAVENALAKLPDVQSVKVDLQSGAAYIEGNPDDHAVQQTVETLGYEIKK
ncbi:MAG: permease [Planctomycetaceae bacterium]|jgi:uncharacterized membrane protein YraQ (UPF0718 family)/copper chaperone CopZ|nr:permease [Planctomycetaceae bacterium]